MDRRTSRQRGLGSLARLGFAQLSDAQNGLERLATITGLEGAELAEHFSVAADPDTALWRILDITAAHPQLLHQIPAEELERLVLLIGASPALGDFFRRNPRRLRDLLAQGGTIRSRAEMTALLCDAVTDGRYSLWYDTECDAAPVSPTPPGVPHTVATDLAAAHGQAGWHALRVQYRETLAELMLFDLEQSRLRRVRDTGDASDLFTPVAAALSDLAGAAIEAALLVARSTVLHPENLGMPVTEAQVRETPLAVVTMGKCGAQELNVVSDVDVLFVTQQRETSALSADVTVRVATRIASEAMRAIHDPAEEPPLWQLDANLRPEGKSGPLVRTLSSYLKYYGRWAETWEFQALLKARASAGDVDIAVSLVAETRELVWDSRNRDDFVGSVQRMRQRVEEHIDPEESEYELKLGPGGLRDVEFSVQLLQLVHGAHDESLREAGTIAALTALVEGGYVARRDGEALAKAYCDTRVLEHRLQLRDLRRTARMPHDDEQLRVLARSSGFGRTAQELRQHWEAGKRTVRALHNKIFYAPLVAAAAELDNGEFRLGADAARARLAGLRFRDPDGALRHLGALTAGTSRRATIFRNLFPVLLSWLSEGTDPDQGLRAFRRLSEASEHLPWFLRLLRDGSDTAERLTTVLASSKFASELLVSQPEAVAWLEDDRKLWPMPLEQLQHEMRRSAERRDTVEKAAEIVRAIHRREVLRIALGRLVGVNSDQDVSEGLDAVHTALLDALLRSLQQHTVALQSVRMALIAMGRYGGGEMGFSSDIDVIAVYAPHADSGESTTAKSEARSQAQRLIQELRTLVSDPRFSVDLDVDLRPEGKNGPLARTIESYERYYAKWSLTWEAQALLRARGVVGDGVLCAQFTELADRIRYPESLSAEQVREIRTLKARVENERLPRGQDSKRNLKVGPGGITDTEWLVQLLQLQHGHAHPELRTTSTLDALQAAVKLGLIDADDARTLVAAWQFASAVRSAEKLWSGKSTDALPSNRDELEGIARVLGYERSQTTQLEERWFSLSRKSRKVFEREFYGQEIGGQTPPGSHPPPGAHTPLRPPRPFGARP